MKRHSNAAKSLAVLALGLAIGVGAARPAAAEVPESKDPVKIALMDWTSVNINAHIYGEILKKLGYNVEYVTADYLSSLTTGLTTGDIDIGLEYWDTTAGDAMKASDATGKTERLGKLGPKAKEEWWYPIYMKEKCPGLPDWHALLDPKCAEAFSTPDTAPKGRYLGGPVTWGGYDDERVQAQSPNVPAKAKLASFAPEIVGAREPFAVVDEDGSILGEVWSDQVIDVLAGRERRT